MPSLLAGVDADHVNRGLESETLKLESMLDVSLALSSLPLLVQEASPGIRPEDRCVHHTDGDEDVCAVMWKASATTSDSNIDAMVVSFVCVSVYGSAGVGGSIYFVLKNWGPEQMCTFEVWNVRTLLRISLTDRYMRRLNLMY